MKAISVNEFYSNFKKYIDSIIKGEHIVLFNKNKKIASIEPVKQNGKRPYRLGWPTRSRPLVGSTAVRPAQADECVRRVAA